MRKRRNEDKSKFGTWATVSDGGISWDGEPQEGNMFHSENAEEISAFHFWTGPGEAARSQGSLCAAWQSGRELVSIAWAEKPEAIHRVASAKYGIGAVNIFPTPKDIIDMAQKIEAVLVMLITKENASLQEDS